MRVSGRMTVGERAADKTCDGCRLIDYAECGRLSCETLDT